MQKLWLLLCRKQYNKILKYNYGEKSMKAFLVLMLT